ncbi:MAG: preprotein translocase subunit YajC [Chloroflexi bacterium]|nr:preprotein translocase subunit YajC [Chloroflexota bacterium]
MPEFILVFAILALVLGGYWALVVFPKQRAFQHKQRIVRSLHVGDEIVTYGGIVGKIIDIDVDKGISHLEIAEGVRIKLLTAALQQVYDPDELAYNASLGTRKPRSERTSSSERWRHREGGAE